ncbi:hypothetical protein S103564_2120 [Staphylococcus aureus subsp. aureus 103564]|nr:hypothetical protein S103564_2120 [Staphylococcus aureus subsp. aureus 103564]
MLSNSFKLISSDLSITINSPITKKRPTVFRIAKRR